jgi:AraC-like DNA-binding protein
MDLVKSLYFAVFFFSVIVFVDLVIKFKRPLLLKACFAILVISIGTASFIYSQNTNPLDYYFYIILIKAIVASAFLNIYSILYFPKFKPLVVSLSIALIGFTIFSLYYNLTFNPAYLSQLRGQTIVIVRDEGLQVPIIFKIIRFFLIISFFGTMIYFLYMMIAKLNLNNIYFDKIKKWSIFITILSVSILMLYLPIPIFRKNDLIGHFISIYFYLYIILLVFYRPNFLNRSALKISFGESFNKETDFAISELDFINEFYTKLYFTNNEASIEHLAKILKIGSNDLYKFVYYKYSMTFNDLVNKNRVDYFIDIIHNPKYLNYTIDALAKEVGFSSRQHLYKPFKKFHGGNPSDIVDAVVSR